MPLDFSSPCHFHSTFLVKSVEVPIHGDSALDFLFLANVAWLKPTPCKLRPKALQNPDTGNPESETVAT